MGSLLSPCCGAGYEDNDKSYCCGAEISESGICMNLDCLDHAESEGYICDDCDDYFEEPEEEIDYNDRMRDNAAEDRSDTKRKYNE